MASGIVYQPIKNIYVAGASSEMPRARRNVELLERAGVKVVSTWFDVVASSGKANPPDDDERLRRANQDLAELQSADLFWFLLPSSGHATNGGYFEFGSARVLKKELVGSTLSDPDDRYGSIFTSYLKLFDSDIHALMHILKRAKENP